MKNDLTQHVEDARDVSTPLIGISTPDDEATMVMLTEAQAPETSVIRWNVGAGLQPMNEMGETALRKMLIEAASDAGAEGMEDIDPTKGNPAAAVEIAHYLPEESILFIQMSHRWFDDPIWIQHVRNRRNELMDARRTLVLLGEHMDLPPELTGHVIVFDEPLPEDERLEQIVDKIVTDADEQGELKKRPDEKECKATAAGLRGANAFMAGQVGSMALRSDRFDREELTERIRNLIEQTPGLSYDEGGETFDKIGGLKRGKQFGERLFNGPRPPRVVVRIEELEKAMAGTKGDLSGTSTDILQVLLSEMEDNDWSGLLAFGAPGAGKSLFSKAIANTFGAFPMRLDANACKGSLVGQSEQNIRNAMKTIKAVGNGDVFFVASMNSMDIPAALIRRFRCGTWFFDLPTAEERAEIWPICLEHYGLEASEEDIAEADAEDLTGADIRNICELAYRLNCSLAEAKTYTVPLRESAPEQIEAARKQADGKYLSVNHEGVYRRKEKKPAGTKREAKRRMALGTS